MRPLPERHPEFTVHHSPGFTEYRVENWHRARDGSGRVVRGACRRPWLDALVLASLATTAASSLSTPVRLAIALAVLSLLRARCTQVLHESLLVFPTLGIQLETHRGHPLLPSPFCTVARQFIPLSALEDLIIHEALQRWNVRFYLAALRRRRSGSNLASTCAVVDRDASRTEGDGGVESVPSSPRGTIQVVVAFENILPHFPILRAVYLGVQETLFPPPTRVVDTDGSGS